MTLFALAAVAGAGCGPILGISGAQPLDDAGVAADAGPDTRLTGLTISEGTLTPAFDPAVTEYDVTLPLRAESLSVTPAAAEPGRVTITVNGTVVASGAASAAIALDLGDNAVTISLGDVGAASTEYAIAVHRGAGIAQRAYLKASNAGAGDQLGTALALSADGATLAAGAPLESRGAVGIDGDGANDGAPESGAVYVFARTGDGWKQQAYVKASDAGAGDHFGLSVALSADGDTLAVGAPDKDVLGAAYVLTRTGGAWSEQERVQGDVSAYAFGNSVALSADGNTLAVGDGREDSDRGAVYVFTRMNGAWSHEAHLVASNRGASDHFGLSVALSGDGDTLAVGATGEDSGATGVDGDGANDDAPDSGAVYVFSRGATEPWAQRAYIKASNTDSSDFFGRSVALSGDGDTLVVGAPGESSAAVGVDGDQQSNRARSSGAAYVFGRDDAGWSQVAYVKASDTSFTAFFGESVALAAGGRVLAVGAWQAADHAVSGGAAYLYTLKAGQWSQQARVAASTPGEFDRFGWSVALSDDTLAVGAPLKGSGAFYVFR